MKNLIAIAAVSATVAALAVPALSQSAGDAKPAPQTVAWTAPVIPGSAPIAAAGLRSEPLRPIRVVYPGGPTGGVRKPAS